MRQGHKNHRARFHGQRAKKHHETREARANARQFPSGCPTSCNGSTRATDATITENLASDLAPWLLHLENLKGIANAER